MPPMERTGKIDVFNGSFAPTTVPGGFRRSFTVPAGDVPFNVQDVGGKVYVTYAPAGHPAQTDGDCGHGTGGRF